MKLMKILALVLLGATWLQTSLHAQSTNGFRTDIETLEAQTNVVIVKGFGQGGTVSAGPGLISVRLKESYNVDTGDKLQALVLDFNEGGVREWAVIDYAEIASLLKGIDFIRLSTYDVSSLPGFDAEYKSKDGFYVMGVGSHRQSSVQTYVQFEGFPRIQLNSDQMSQLRSVIEQAREALDALKASK